MRPDLLPLVDEGLGNSTYLLDLGDGRALVVDPPRDLRRVRAAAAARGLLVAFAADTHLHADFATGAVQLAEDEKATVLAGALGTRRYRHRALYDGDEVDLGGLRLRALTTPGHTVEHLAYLLLDGDAPVGVFSGGSLIVGSAARTDLAGPEHTRALTRAQYVSLQRLLALPDDVELWPTHGVGSFCSAPPGSARTSTIGTERQTNALARAATPDQFATELIGSLGSYPPYFDRLPELNRQGPALLGPPRLDQLDPATVQQLMAGGGQLVDTRPVADYASGHIPGALSIPLRPVFASWLGWLTRSGQPLAFVRNADQDPDEIVMQAANIGLDQLAGELSGGMATWTAAGLTTRTTELVPPGRVGDRQVLDVRQAPEWSDGHLPGARHVELGALAHESEGLPAAGLVVMCGHGERAASAASVLERAGHTGLAILAGGAQDWSDATGRALERS